MYFIVVLTLLHIHENYLTFYEVARDKNEIFNFN